MNINGTWPVRTIFQGIVTPTPPLRKRFLTPLSPPPPPNAVTRAQTTDKKYSSRLTVMIKATEGKASMLRTTCQRYLHMHIAFPARDEGIVRY